MTTSTRALALALWLPAAALAADHAEAPTAAADPAADIADLYAWAADGELTAILTFAPLTAPGGAATYDAEVAYGFHIDNDGDAVSDVDVWVKFGQNKAGEWGMQVSNLPGASADAVSGPVGEVNVDGDVAFYANVHDDPFFFDLEGYTDTLSTATLAFDAERDSLAGVNVTAIALTMDAEAATDGASSLQIWSTTVRK